MDKVKISIWGGTALIALGLIWLYWTMSGHFFFDVQKRGDQTETLVIRAGKPSLRLFHWLPSKPSFGSIIADTGLRQGAFEESAWQQFKNQTPGGLLATKDYGIESAEHLKPQIRQLIRYAATGSEDALNLAWESSDKTSSESLNTFFNFLLPLSTGSEQEISIVDEAIHSKNKELEMAGLSFAANAAKNNVYVFEEMFQNAASSKDESLRAAALTLLSKHSEKRNKTSSEKTSIQRDQRDQRVAKAVKLISDGKASKKIRARGFQLIRNALIRKPQAMLEGLAQIISSDRSSNQDKTNAIELALLYGHGQPSTTLVDALLKIFSRKDNTLKNQALGALARLDKNKTREFLATLGSYTTHDEKLQLAIALAWREIARDDSNSGIKEALTPLRTSSSPSVRGAVLKALGSTKNISVSELLNALGDEHLAIVEGAALGLADQSLADSEKERYLVALEALWNEPGAKQIIAASSYAAFAIHTPSPVFKKLVSAAKVKNNSRLNQLGIRGLCHASQAKHPNALASIRPLLKNKKSNLHNEIITCLQKNLNASIPIAQLIAESSQPQIRNTLANTLLFLGTTGALSEDWVLVVKPLLSDKDNNVRQRAIETLTTFSLKENVPALQSIVRNYKNASEDEKLFILEKASLLGAIDLPSLALSDKSTNVRIAGIQAALELNQNADKLIGSALQDTDATVQLAALQLMLTHPSDHINVDRHLIRSIASANKELSSLALVAFVKSGELNSVLSLIESDLVSPTASVRKQAAAACNELAKRAPEKTGNMLFPLLNDSSREVRVAAAPALMRALAATLSFEQLADKLLHSERNATERPIYAGGIILKSSNEDPGTTTLESIFREGPPMAAMTSKIALGLLSRPEQSIGFMTLLMP